MLTVPYSVMRSTNTPDGAGSTTPTTTTTGSGMCLIGPLNQPTKSIFAEKIGTRQAWIVVAPYRSDILPSDKLAIAGTTYQVLGLIPHLTHLQVVTVSLT